MRLIYATLVADLLVSFLMSVGIIYLLLYISYRNNLFDLPDGRKVHHIPVPRLGGMSFLPTVLTVCLLTFAFLYTYGRLDTDFAKNRIVIRMAGLFAGGFLVFLAGIVDDVSGLDYRIKFLAQFLAAVILVCSGLWLHTLYGLFGIHDIPAWVGKPLTVLFIMLMINAMNMIDGIDGLASGITILAMGMMFVIFLHLRCYSVAMVDISALGAILAFWCFNVFGKEEKRTKIFMGDSGSMIVGLILSYLTVSVSYMNYGPNYPENRIILVPVLSVFAIPLLEVVRLFFQRISQHRSPFLADANHIHHRLLRLGLNAHQALIVILALEVVFTGVGVLLVKQVNVNVIFLVEVAMFLGVHQGISLLAARRGVE